MFLLCYIVLPEMETRPRKTKKKRRTKERGMQAAWDTRAANEKATHRPWTLIYLTKHLFAARNVRFVALMSSCVTLTSLTHREDAMASATSSRIEVRREVIAWRSYLLYVLFTRLEAAFLYSCHYRIETMSCYGTSHRVRIRVHSR